MATEFNPDDLAAQTVKADKLPEAPSRREPNAYENLVKTREPQKTPVFPAEYLTQIKNRVRNAASHLDMGVSIRVTDAKDNLVTDEDTLENTAKIRVHFMGKDKRSYNPKDDTEKAASNGGPKDQVANPGQMPAKKAPASR